MFLWASLSWVMTVNRINHILIYHIYYYYKNIKSTYNIIILIICMSASISIFSLTYVIHNQPHHKCFQMFVSCCFNVTWLTKYNLTGSVTPSIGLISLYVRVLVRNSVDIYMYITHGKGAGKGTGGTLVYTVIPPNKQPPANRTGLERDCIIGTDPDDSLNVDRRLDVVVHKKKYLLFFRWKCKAR